MSTVFSELVSDLGSDPLRLLLAASLLVLLALAAYTAHTMTHVRQGRSAAITSLEARLSELEQIVNEIDPAATEQRTKNLASALRSLLEYSESIRPPSAREPEEVKEESVT